MNGCFRVVSLTFLLALVAGLVLVSYVGSSAMAVIGPGQVTTSSSTITTYTSLSSSFTSTSTLTFTNVTTLSSYTGTVTSGATSIVIVTATTSEVVTSTKTSTSTTTSVSLPPIVPSCPVAAVAAGSVLEPYANSLRVFRNNYIMKTSAGRAFMSVFNTWYYAWAPSLARAASENHELANALRVILVPLFGILYASYFAFVAAAPMSTEAGAIMAGIVAASLMGLVYVAPWAYLALRILRLHRHQVALEWRYAMPVAAWVVGSGLLSVAGYALDSFALIGLATASLTLSTLILASIVGVKAIASIKPWTTNPAFILNVKRYMHD